MPPRADVADPDAPTALTRLADRLSSTGHDDLLDSSTLSRALYSTDASIYRIVPLAVAKPRTVEEFRTLLTHARLSGTAITTRGGGTSCAGNAVGPGVIVDVSRHLDTIHAIDAQARTAVVEPGVIQADLSAAAAPFGLKFGPDPSTFNRCTIGGMIGNNACGPRALGYGKTADNVLGLRCITGGGEELVLGGNAPTRVEDSPTLTALKELVGANLETIRTQFGQFGRQVSGYSLEHLLPENGFDVARFLAGTEGTLVAITEATVRLVADPPVRTLVALGYPSMDRAADDAMTILGFSPTACEGLDRRLVSVVEAKQGVGSVPRLPAGDGWMLVEISGTDSAEVHSRAEAMLAAAHCLDGFIVDDGEQAVRLWRIRADGAGLAGVSLPSPAYPGWEDAAVPPARLGDYLRDFDALLTRYGFHGLPYGHFGDGCVHVRIDFGLTDPDGPQNYRAFVLEAATLVASYGGSMSGEHGDGRARSELLPAMYSPEALGLFAQVKHLFDPSNLFNPGVLVDPDPVDHHVRAAGLTQRPLFSTDSLFVTDVHRCSGVGKCIADTSGAGGIMCPSYQATRDEKDSTRGRARVLQELVNGELVQGWDAPELHEALDLCLSCKGCRRDCPTGVDMASYKSQATDHRYQGKLRPRSHYALGWLPRWGRLVTRFAPVAKLANLTMGTPGLRSLLRWGAGVDQRRDLPRFAERAATSRGIALPKGPTPRGPVLLWVDSFSDCFADSAVQSYLDVLYQAGYSPRLLDRPACCGLTWISTGQRDGARAQLANAVEVLHPYVADGVPIVAMEPSCQAVWRSDAEELLPEDPRIGELASGILTLAELLIKTPDWQPPDLIGRTIIAQPHCHHAAVLGFQADAKLLAATGAEITTLGGCCGLAGNFGVEKGHYEVSVAVAEHDLLPAVRAAGPDAIVVADGFSCRLQLEQLGGRQAITLADLLNTRPQS